MYLINEKRIIIVITVMNVFNKPKTNYKIAFKFVFNRLFIQRNNLVYEISLSV